jgi:hypothetical protein
MKEIKTIIIFILIVYLSFLGEYLFYENTHDLFSCKQYEFISGWNCTTTHIATSVVLFLVLVLGLIALVFKNQLK